MAKHYDTTNDPVHWTARDGRVAPVDGTHDLRRVEGELMAYLDDEPCGVCSLTPTSLRADRWMVGQWVEWSYHAGTARGQVIAIARTRVQVMWQRVRKQARPIWKRAIDLRPVARP